MLTRMMMTKKTRKTRKSRNHVNEQERVHLHSLGDGLQQQRQMVSPRLLKRRSLGNHAKAMLPKSKRIQMKVQCLVDLFERFSN